MDKLALFWDRLDDSNVQCFLCPHRCILKHNELGKCRVRKNIDNKLHTINYGEIAGCSLDPIEKKPLFHFYPFSKILSVGSYMCNLTCTFCQNYSSSQNKCTTVYTSPEDLTKMCLDKSINLAAFTYNEPTIWYEYIYDCAKLLYQNNIKVVLVTNGFINIEPLKSLIPYISAVNVDLKAYNNNFYKNICGGNLQSVLESIMIYAENTHIEITTLIIESLNDSEEEIRQLCKFISAISKDIPLHLSRYFPRYKLKIPETSEDTVYKLTKICREYLNYVYPGNAYDKRNIGLLNTFCPNCQTLLVDRLSCKNYISKRENPIEDNFYFCPKCNKKIYGIFL